MLHRAYKFRILLVTLVLLMMFMGAAARLYYFQVVRHDFFLEKAAGIQERRREVPPFRGEILDRDGNVLAMSAVRHAVYVDVGLIEEGEKERYLEELNKKFPERKDKDYLRYKDRMTIKKRAEKKKAELARKLAPVLNVPPEMALDLIKRYRHPVLAHKVTDDIVEACRAVRDEMDLHVFSVYFREESKRLYPRGRLLAPVLGYCGISATGDDVGFFGLEKRYDEAIRGSTEISQKMRRTALSQYLTPIEQDILDSSYGNRLVLTIDQSIQYAAERALKKGAAKWDADSASAVVMEVETGRILAMCSLPSFDPNDFTDYDSELRRNRCVSEAFEPGSVMKIFTSAMMLEHGKLSMEEIIDCENGRARIDGRRVTDAGGHAMGRVPFPQTFYHSSNVAFSKIGLRMDHPEYYECLRRFGFGRKTGIDLPHESPGILHPLPRWTRLSRTSLAIGYEIALTPLQTTCAVAAMGNDGVLMRPYVVEQIQDFKGKAIQKFEPRERWSVCSPETAARVLALMGGVVEEGTGEAAAIEGYRVGGKTATTRKSHKAEPEYIAGFAGLFPLDDPKICVYVAIDDPKGAYYASQVAAPVFQEIARSVLTELAIPPQVIEKEDAEFRMARELEVKTLEPDAEPAFPTRPIRDGAMPELSGLTMREVLELMEDSPLDLRFVGSGVVIEQNPPPLTALAEVKECVLVFGRDQKAAPEAENNLNGGS